MAVDRTAANRQMLQQTSEVQDKSVETVFRIQQQVQETETLATATIEELRIQSRQMDEIDRDLDAVSSKLDHSQALQNKFDVWAGNWFGGKKRAALKEAAGEIADKNQEDSGKIKEVFEQERYESFSRTWKPAGMVLCTNPSVTAPQLFDPSTSEESMDGTWRIDYNHTGVDAQGWSYGADFNTLNTRGGENQAKWNHYVRRRKWRHVEKKTATATGLEAVKERSNARATTAAASARTTQAEKVGYQPRQRAAPSFVASGITSSSMKGRKAPDQELDAESEAALARVNARDNEINAGLDVIGDGLDRLGRIAVDMREEVVAQGTKVASIENKMQIATEKQAVVNARMRKHVQSS